ncbi:MAG: thrombospondin type 3 repeat-containing protein [Gammaproteobacteria bacterium]
MDTDADGSNDNTDNCPIDSNSDQLNTDGDELGNTSVMTMTTVTAYPMEKTAFPRWMPIETTDTDGDDTGDNSDNCPAIANEDQLDTDNDTLGNACDDDDDGDTLSDAEEQAQGTNPLLADTDSDGSADSVDNCPVLANANQADSNDNGVGDVCEGRPADIAGFWLAAITVSDVQQTGSAPQGANLAEICDAAIDDKKAGVAFVKQQGNDINLNFDEAMVTVMANPAVLLASATFSLVAAWMSIPNTTIQLCQSGRFVHGYRSLELQRYAGCEHQHPITGTSITETIEIYAGEDLGAGTSGHLYLYPDRATLNMSAVDASAILNPAGADQGIAFTDSWRNYFSETGVDIFEFGYSTVTTSGATDFAWNGAAFDKRQSHPLDVEQCWLD